MAFMPMFPPGTSRTEMYEAMDAGVALDLIFVRMTTMYSNNERPYPETRKEVQKMLKKAAAPLMTQGERMRESIVAMSKYRKAK